MTSEEQIAELLLQWDDLREQGQHVSAEELCRDCPDLVVELRRRIEALEAVGQVPNGFDRIETTRSEASGVAAVRTQLPEVPGYEILGVLGSGGMGVVYKARQQSLNRTVALKMILAGAHAGASAVARFLQEAEIIAHLKHPNIVQVHDFGSHEGRPYFSLEYLEGGSLADRLHGEPELPSRAARMVEELARAVQAAHEQGIVHRDLKPANVLLSADGTLKITDFGVAKQGDSMRTVTGEVLGTPNYMAPEQAEGNLHAVGPQTDVHALGVVLYQLLTGQLPFRGATLLETLEQVRSHEPRPPSALQPGVPRDLDTICLKCLEKEPRHRYASALELAEDLRRYLQGELIHARSFTLVDRVARTLNRDHQVVQFHALGNLMLGLAPFPALLNAIGFLLIRQGWPHITALALTFASIAALVVVTLWASFGWHLLPMASSLRDFWALRIGHWAGILLIPFLCYLLTPPGQPWEPLTAYPLWALVSGVALFSMGSSFWGRFYGAGVGLFVLAFIMALQLEWAVLELGLVMSVLFTSIALHLRRISTGRSQQSMAEQGTSTK
jgi:serine/threonine-protein kinase